MDRVFSVDELSDQFWLPPPSHPPFPAPDEPKMNRSASEWAFQRFLQEAAASSVSDTTSSSKLVGENDVVENKDRAYQKNPHINQGVNGILSKPVLAAATKPFDTGSSVPIDSDEYQEFLKSRLNLACAAVALTKAPYVIGQRSFGVAEPESTSQGSADSHSVTQASGKGSENKDAGGPIGVPSLPALPKKVIAQTKQTTSGSSREQSDDDEAEGENETTENMDPSDVKKVRRMLSNRESARRSRRRKQAHLTELETQVAQLKVENSSLLKRLTNVSQKYNEASVDNRVLTADVETLRAKVKMAEGMVKRVTGMSPLLQSMSGISTMRNPSSDSSDAAVPVINLYQPPAQTNPVRRVETLAGPEIASAENMLSNQEASMAGVNKMGRTPSMQRVASLEHLQKNTWGHQSQQLSAEL